MNIYKVTLIELWHMLLLIKKKQWTYFLGRIACEVVKLKLYKNVMKRVKKKQLWPMYILIKASPFLVDNHHSVHFIWTDVNGFTK